MCNSIDEYVKLPKDVSKIVWTYLRYSSLSQVDSGALHLSLVINSTLWKLPILVLLSL